MILTAPFSIPNVRYFFRTFTPHLYVLFHLLIVLDGTSSFSAISFNFKPCLYKAKASSLARFSPLFVCFENQLTYHKKCCKYSFAFIYFSFFSHVIISIVHSGGILFSICCGLSNETAIFNGIRFVFLSSDIFIANTS